MSVICDKCNTTIVSPQHDFEGDNFNQKNILKVNGATFCLCEDCYLDVSDKVEQVISNNEKLPRYSE